MRRVILFFVALAAAPGLAQFNRAGVVAFDVSGTSASANLSLKGRDNLRDLGVRTPALTNYRMPTFGFSGGTGGGFGPPPSELLPSAVGFPRYVPFTAPIIGDLRLTTGALQNYSGFSARTSLEAPIGGWDLGPAPEAKTPLFMNPEPRTPFCEFFGMRASDPKPQPTDLPSREIESNAIALRDVNDQYVASLWRRAETVFKQATDPNEPDHYDRMGRAVRLLSTVRDLDRTSYLPSLLIVHASLDRQQPTLAAVNLLDAVERNPGLFVEDDLHLDEYFSAAPQLKEQARAYLRVGELDASDPAMSALQAYCAWIAGDRARARQALETTTELALASREISRYRQFRTAMEAALQ